MRVSTSAGAEWWRPETPVEPASGAAPAFGSAIDRAPLGGRTAFVSLLAFTIILFLAPQERIPALAALRIAAVSAGLAFVSYWIDRLLAGRMAPPPAREVRITLVLVAWAIVTVPFSLWPGGSVQTLTELYLKSVLVFWLLGATLLSVDRLRIMAWTLALAALPIAATGIVNYATGVYDDGRVAGYQSGIAQNPNDLALTLNLILPLCVALAAVSRRPLARVFAGLIAMLCVAGVIVTFSRGGFVTLLAMTVLIAAAFLRGRALMALGALAMAAVVSIPFLPDGYLDRLSTITDVQSDRTHSAQERQRDMLVAIDYIGTHPFMGAGAGQHILALNELRGASWMPVHNVYLEYGADLGLPGLALFAAVFVLATRGARRVERAQTGRQDPERHALGRIAGAVRIALVGFAVAGLFHPVAYYFYFYYLAGLSVAVQRTAKVSV